MITTFRRYCWNLLVSIDQLLNALLGGDPDETISSRMGKYVRRGRGWIPCQLCKLLNLLHKDHCLQSIEDDEGGK